jgi:hypothetical protein
MSRRSEEPLAAFSMVAPSGHFRLAPFHSHPIRQQPSCTCHEKRSGYLFVLFRTQSVPERSLIF